MGIGCGEDRVSVLEEISRIRNLRPLGRSGGFAYAHLHDMMREGQTVAQEMRREREGPSRR